MTSIPPAVELHAQLERVVGLRLELEILGAGIAGATRGTGPLVGQIAAEGCRTGCRIDDDLAGQRRAVEVEPAGFIAARVAGVGQGRSVGL